MLSCEQLNSQSSPVIRYALRLCVCCLASSTWMLSTLT